MTIDGPQICALGLDAGSTTAKIVGVDAQGRMVWRFIEPASTRVEAQAEHLIAIAAEAAGRSAAFPLVATGYGRGLVREAGRKVTEITCHARGAFRELGHGGTLMDIGGQDSKVIVITSQGEVQDFAMSDKCAAGTGRFLENTAARLGVPLDEMGSLALSTAVEARISSTCTVFAESEVISLIAQGVALEAILRGLHRSLLSRITALVHSLGLVKPLMLSGGVACNQAVRQMLVEVLGTPVLLPAHPQFLGAYGAALAALEAVAPETRPERSI